MDVRTRKRVADGVVSDALDQATPYLLDGVALGSQGGLKHTLFA